ncbi:MAG TPA: DegT/DnrJ/EryC1/StrS family aminotransferase [Actinomycetota bacterium]|nr:DegT/DnrJ/EryC1/StrS family aminotransferase [Actinomycetota bacterium]
MIPVNEPQIGELEIEYVNECLRTGWISSAGRFINEFEERWAEYCGRKYAIACSNGTTALELAIEALDLEDGDEVIIPTFTIVSCAQAVIYGKGKPVLIDSDPETWCMDTSRLEEAITPKTKAIMPVHIYGHPVDMDSVLQLAEKHGLTVIEDAAEAHGAEYYSSQDGSWRRCGGFGEMSCFSFYGNKLVTTGEGGMVLTDDPRHADALRSLRNLCFQPERRFFHERLGHNARLTNVQAAMGAAQVQRIDEIVDRKRECGREYSERLSGVPGIQIQVEKDWARSVWWMYGIVVEEETGLTAVKLADLLAGKGVETRPFFLGMHEQPFWSDRGLPAGSFPVAERLARQGLYLPSGTALTDEQLTQVAGAVAEVMSNVGDIR